MGDPVGSLWNRCGAYGVVMGMKTTLKRLAAATALLGATFLTSACGHHVVVHHYVVHHHYVRHTVVHHIVHHYHH